MILVVHGTPIAQPRHRVAIRGGFPRTYLATVKDRVTGKSVDHPVVAYKQRIAIAAREAGPMLTGPVEVAVRFYMPIPKKYRRWATDLRQREQAMQSKPDVDNLAKAVLDALAGVAFADDRQVVSLHAEKWNSTMPLTEIELRGRIISQFDELPRL